MMDLTRENITALLLREDVVGMHAVGRALSVLTKRQTLDERQVKQTKHSNARGFTKSDGKRGVEDAMYYHSMNYLSKWTLMYWREKDARGTPRIAKYWAQLIEEAQDKQSQRQQASQAGIHPDEIRMMQMEAEGDLLGTIRDERNKQAARQAMEAR